MKTPTIKMVCKDGEKAADVSRVTGFGEPHWETTTYTKFAKNSVDYNIKASGTFKEAIEKAREWTKRHKSRNDYAL